LSELKELNETAPRFMTPKLHRKQCIYGRPHKFFQGSNVKIFLILYRLLTIQCKWAFTKYQRR